MGLPRNLNLKFQLGYLGRLNLVSSQNFSKDFLVHHHRSKMSKTQERGLSLFLLLARVGPPLPTFMISSF